MAGKIDSVYVNFENQGWFWIDPQGVDFFNNVTQRRLENMLTELFADGILINAVTNEASWRRVDIEQVFATFPANTHITGLLLFLYKSIWCGCRVETKNIYFLKWRCVHAYVINMP